jgi:uncharacterized protein (TIGR01244 family)
METVAVTVFDSLWKRWLSPFWIPFLFPRDMMDVFAGLIGDVMLMGKLFFISVFITTCVMIVVYYVNRPSARPTLLLLSDDISVYVTSQLQPRDVYSMRRSGMNTIVDLRPDGEAPDEPSHSQIEQAAKKTGLAFAYIPVPHESIPPAAVRELGDVIASSPKPVVLYCRTGRRSVRTFALFEASRRAGPSALAILEKVKNAGFSADDLRTEIVSRIAARTPASETQP